MKTINHNNHYTPIQMKIPVDLEKIIEISDPTTHLTKLWSKWIYTNILLRKKAKQVAQDLTL